MRLKPDKYKNLFCQLLESHWNRRIQDEINETTKIEAKKSLAVHFSELIRGNMNRLALAT
jgi:hypothetical protein